MAAMNLQDRFDKCYGTNEFKTTAYYKHSTRFPEVVLVDLMEMVYNPMYHIHGLWPYDFMQTLATTEPARVAFDALMKSTAWTTGFHLESPLYHLATLVLGEQGWKVDPSAVTGWSKSAGEVPKLANLRYNLTALRAGIEKITRDGLEFVSHTRLCPDPVNKKDHGLRPAIGLNACADNPDSYGISETEYFFNEMRDAGYKFDAATVTWTK